MSEDTVMEITVHNPVLGRVVAVALLVTAIILAGIAVTSLGAISTVGHSDSHAATDTQAR